MSHLHIVGAGWAGLSAAIHGVLSGHQVTIYEMAPQVGGRARGVTSNGLSLDNGQHILTGACTLTLELMQRVGMDERRAFFRLPMRFSTPTGRTAQWLGHPSSVGRLWGLITDHEMNLNERIQWIQCLMALKTAQPREWLNSSTGAWLDRHARPQVRPWFEALCTSALNLNADQANAAIFLQVMQESFKTPQSSDLLLPRLNLSELSPDSAVRWLMSQGAQVCTGHRVEDISPLLETGEVVLACSAAQAARLTQTLAPAWSELTRQLPFTGIATVYTQWKESSQPPLPDPLIFLPHDLNDPAQVVIDVGQLRPHDHPKGLWSWVVSHAQLDRQTTIDRVLDQAVQVWGRRPEFKACFLDARATLAAVPSVQRPGPEVSPGVWACGDYLDSLLPSTLEGAVRSGQAVVQRIMGSRTG